MMRMGFPMMLSGMIGNIYSLKERYPTHEDLYNDKIVFNYNRISKIQETSSNVKANQDAAKLLQIADRNLNESGA